jgi:chromatin segregation and condensation protein Rec8/ScpA/Scc1 (kleisin family)
MTNEFIITIDQFDGPLDLMLHLIRENKLDLFNLDILALTNQYVAFIRAMEELNLEVASEYLVEMANLLEYKSKKLLPKEKAAFENFCGYFLAHFGIFSGSNSDQARTIIFMELYSRSFTYL